MITRDDVVTGVSQWMMWWVNQRLNKLREQLTDSMSTNPFMLPFLLEFHSLDDFDGLADLTLSSHLITGHKL
jgi:hypothetical protein